MTRHPPEPARVAVILVNWNGWQDTVACLDSLLGCDYPDCTIFVVDNASTDGSVERIAAWCHAPVEIDAAARRPGVASGAAAGARPSVDVIENPGPGGAPYDGGARVVLVRAGGNLGFAGGNNVGMRLAGLANYEFFWLLNNDTVIEARALSTLVARASQDKRVGMTGSSLVYFWRPDEVQALGGASFDSRTGISRTVGQGMPTSRIPDDPATVEPTFSFVVGASILVSREFVREIGLMCEDYFLYFEELDWALRSRGRFALGYAPRSIVYHKVGGSSRRVASPGALRHLHRNRLKFAARFTPRHFVPVMLQLAFEMAKLCLRGRFGESRVLAGALLNAGGLWREGRRNWTGAYAGL